jgi:NAD(P)-dependent dehydrogenase (short-subunit alcohol dehydrogenase family)
MNLPVAEIKTRLDGLATNANILFTMELVHRLEGTGVSINALHPGFVAIDFAKNKGKVIAAIVSLFAPLVARSPAKGAKTLIYLASSPSVEGITGTYFNDSHVIPSTTSHRYGGCQKIMG